MFSEIDLEMPACCICSLSPFESQSEDMYKFVIGTCHPTETNRLHLLEYKDEVKHLQSVTSWSCSEPILEISSPSCSLSNKQFLSTSSHKELRFLRLTESAMMEQPELVFTRKGWYRSVSWNVEGETCSCKAIFNDNTIVSIDVNKSDADGVTILGTFDNAILNSYQTNVITQAVPDPHHPSLLMCCTEVGSLHLFDCRAKKFTNVTRSTPVQSFSSITNVSYSSSHMYSLLSCHNDGCIQLHDLRFESNTKNNLFVNSDAHINYSDKQSEYKLETRFMFQAHEHSVRKALFNPFHDELIVSASADETVKLWDVNVEANRVMCINELNNFGDSVYDVTWSNNGPWVYAAVSYNGHVMVDSVPNNKRMSILLEENEYLTKIT